ncbi:hypothetical protein Vafri_9907 [Volvox africanus]|uniref:AP2/ERF domain-containing protein n=1 Tax=Volvox africanus TaxID=51714 RepID=A0A8J4F038_9CHLO|nr:hypothetical protein Vafri_9907 [Volvox africanus]
MSDRTDLIQLGGGIAVKEQLDLLQARLRQGGVLFQPTICRPRSITIRELEYLQEVGLCVPDWGSHRPTKNRPSHVSSTAALRVQQRIRVASQHQLPIGKVGTAMKLLRAVKSKANGSGRTYTSKYRGVHQTFPTKRWEAQFRRNGKPTSLGCFDNEEEAARAYDKMMLWCELHNAAGVKSGITNFDPTEYEKEFAWLQAISQDELIETLRSEGRRQAAHRAMRQKREGFAEPPTEEAEDQAQSQLPQQQEQAQLQRNPSQAGLEVDSIAATAAVVAPSAPAADDVSTIGEIQQQPQGAADADMAATEGLVMGGFAGGDNSVELAPVGGVCDGHGGGDDGGADAAMLTSDEFLMDA